MGVRKKILLDDKMAAAPTPFLNENNKRIFKSLMGRFFTNSKNGKVYNPKAAFRRTPGSTSKRVVGDKAKVPRKLKRKTPLTTANNPFNFSKY